MRVAFIDAGSGTELHSLKGSWSRSDFVVGDTVSIVSDIRFGRTVTIIGEIQSVEREIVDMSDGTNESNFLISLSTR